MDILKDINPFKKRASGKFWNLAMLLLRPTFGAKAQALKESVLKEENIDERTRQEILMGLTPDSAVNRAYTGAGSFGAGQKELGRLSKLFSSGTEQTERKFKARMQAQQTYNALVGGDQTRIRGNLLQAGGRVRK